MTSAQQPTRTNPLSDLRQLIRGSIILARAERAFGELLGWESAEEVAEQAVSHQRGLAASAHKAETYDREALRLMDEAQQPDSDGGENITPAEAKRIRLLAAKSAEIDHDVSERAAV